MNRDTFEKERRYHLSIRCNGKISCSLYTTATATTTAFLNRLLMYFYWINDDGIFTGAKEGPGVELELIIGAQTKAGPKGDGPL